MKEHTTPEKLELYAFYWSVVRLVVAALSLIFGAVPIAYRIFGYAGSSMVSSLMPLFWLVSGAASAYLLYLWFSSGKKVFGSDDKTNMVVFLIMVISGLNLGYAAIGANIGMNLVWDMAIADTLFKLTGLVYLFCAYHMWKKWNANGQKLFDATTVVADEHNSAEPDATNQQKNI